MTVTWQHWVGSSKRRPTSCGVLSDSMEQMSTHCIQIFVKFLHTFRSRRVVSRGVEQVGSRHYSKRKKKTNVRNKLNVKEVGGCHKFDA
jgi:hypothetical protein